MHALCRPRHAHFIRSSHEVSELVEFHGRDNSATIQQDADIYRIRLKAGQSVSRGLVGGRGLWLQLIHGEVSANGATLAAGDAISSEDVRNFNITAIQDAETILFNLA